MNFTLECLDCAQQTAATVKKLRCDRCDGLFKLSYESAPDSSKPRIPVSALEQQVRLGEGKTPVVNLGKTAKSFGLKQLWAKLEFMAPTGSFKDRGSAILISAALAEGVTEFVEDSSGNAGASLSAYAAGAGMKAHVFAPATAARGKLDQIQVFGAELHAVEGPRQAATDAAEQFVAERGLPYLSHNLSPYFSEGMKAVAYEITGSGPGEIQHIVLPVGNGSLLIGAKAGYDELVESGSAGSAPKFHAVQADNVRPVTAAIDGSAWHPGDAKPTVASGISVSLPPRLNQCVSAVRESGGTAVSVGEEATLEWQQRLARDEGIFCEATSATAFVGLEKLMATGAIDPGESVLIPVTGSGLKEPLKG